MTTSSPYSTPTNPNPGPWTAPTQPGPYGPPPHTGPNTGSNAAPPPASCTGPIPVTPPGVAPGVTGPVPPNTSAEVARRPGTDVEPVRSAGPPAWLERVGSAKRLPEIVSQAHPSLIDVVAEAHEPTPGHQFSPPWEPAWTYAVRIPLLARANATLWASKNPARLAVAAVVAVLAIYLAGFLPYVGPVLDWIVPRVLNPHTW